MREQTSDLQTRIGALSAGRKRLLQERLRHLRGIGQPSHSGRLVAFVSGNGTGELDTSELRHLCEEKLAGYMVPQLFVQLAELPKTTAGKVDRMLLQARCASIETTRDSSVVEPRNATEDKLARIWSEVLGIDDISVYDNFFEVGGDSLLSIRIISRAAVEGLCLAPDIIFSHPTIAGQAALASLAPTIKADAGTVSGPLPLMPIQYWFFENITVDADQWNQSLLFEICMPLSTTDLERAVQKVLAHHDALRSRFQFVDGAWHAHISSVNTDVPLYSMDISDLSPSDGRVKVQGMAEKLNASFDVSVAPLLKVAHVRTARDTPDLMLIVAHHLVVDVESWRILISDLETVCKQIMENQTIGLPAKTTSLRTWSARLTEYANSEVFQGQPEFWCTNLPERIASIPLPETAIGTPNNEREGKTVSVSMEESLTEDLLHRVSQAFHTRISAVLISALARVVSAWLDTSDVVIDLEGHGREPLFNDVDVSRTVGWFTTVFPMVLCSRNIEDWNDPVTALRLVKEQLRVIPLNGLSYGLAKNLKTEPDNSQMVDKMSSRQILFNYLGQTSHNFGTGHCLRLIDDSCGPTRSPRCERAYLVEVNARVEEGLMRVDWTYNESMHDEQTIKHLANAFLSRLTDLIQAAQTSVDGAVMTTDFPLADLNQEELEKLSKQLDDLDDD